MNHEALPPGLPPQPDELDRLLSAYFKHQLPTPWPAFRADPSAEPSGLVARGSAGRSRATLAVSAAVLLGLGLVLSSGSWPAPSAGTPAPQAGRLLPDSKASGQDLMKHMGDTPTPAQEPAKGPVTP